MEESKFNFEEEKSNEKAVEQSKEAVKKDAKGLWGSIKQPTGGKPMGIFTRFRDIISSNINAMLDKAEDPEKLIKLMIREMEDTLVEIKAACAGVMAAGKKVQRQLKSTRDRVQYWEEKAEMARIERSSRKKHCWL